MFIKEIINTYQNAKISCCNERCNIRINTKNNSVMLKGELIVKTQPEKICDCIVFQDNHKIAIIELKSSSFDVGNILSKFKNSGSKSIAIAHSFEKKSDFDLYLILLAKSYSNYFAHDRLRRSRIKINGNAYRILFGKCGCGLKDFLN